GERVLWYTDGLADARARDGRTFPFGEQMRDCLNDPRLDHALDRLLALVTEHSGGRPDDDLALVLSEPLPADRSVPAELFEAGARDPWPAQLTAARLTPSASAMTVS